MKVGTLMGGASLLIALALPCAANVRSEADTKVRETQVSYLVDHADKTREGVVVKYEAFLYHKVWQTGSAAEPLKGKFVDDRACHYSVNARLYRRAYILSHSGVQAPVEEYQAVYDVSKVDKRGPDNSFEAISYHQTCGAVNLFKNRIDSARADLLSQFDQLVARDDDKTRDRLKAMLVASKITLVAAR